MSIFDKTDVVAQYYRLRFGTLVNNSISEWIGDLEEIAIEFMVKVFNVNTGSSRSRTFKPTDQTKEELDDLLSEVVVILTEVGNKDKMHLQHLLADLIFMRNQNFSKINNAETTQIIERFHEPKVEKHEEIPTEIRLRNVIVFVDKLRHKLGSLLQTSSCIQFFGKSPMEILSELRTMCPPLSFCSWRYKPMIKHTESDLLGNYLQRNAELMKKTESKLANESSSLFVQASVKLQAYKLGLTESSKILHCPVSTQAKKPRNRSALPKRMPSVLDKSTAGCILKRFLVSELVEDAQNKPGTDKGKSRAKKATQSKSRSGAEMLEKQLQFNAQRTLLERHWFCSQYRPSRYVKARPKPNSFYAPLKLRKPKNFRKKKTKDKRSKTPDYLSSLIKREGLAFEVLHEHHRHISEYRGEQEEDEEDFVEGLEDKEEETYLNDDEIEVEDEEEYEGEFGINEDDGEEVADSRKRVEGKKGKGKSGTTGKSKAKKKIKAIAMLTKLGMK